MPYLEAPGASIYYEVTGKGPVLLCISGADGSADIWKGVGAVLQDQVTVVAWDRRGFSRSYLDGAQDYSQRIERDADDASLLINLLSPGVPATVIGNSSGALVALKLLTRHPDLIKTLVSYEPPAAKLLPDFEDLWAQQTDIYDTYRASGMAPAMDKFAAMTMTHPAMLKRFLDPRSSPFSSSNWQYWFERELMYYPKTDFDVEGELRPLKDKLLLVNGELSNREPLQYRANVAIAEKLGLEVVHLPGEHVGHATHAVDFSQALCRVLKKRDPQWLSS